MSEPTPRYAVFKACGYRKNPTDRGELLAEFGDVWRAVEYQAAYRGIGCYEIWIERQNADR